MRSNALKKNAPLEMRSVSSLKLVVANDSDKRRRDIARQAEEACNMPGNINGPDLDLFGSDFA